MFVEPLVFNYTLCFGEGTKKYEDLLPDLERYFKREIRWMEIIIVGKQ